MSQRLAKENIKLSGHGAPRAARARWAAVGSAALYVLDVNNKQVLIKEFKSDWIYLHNHPVLIDKLYIHVLARTHRQQIAMYPPNNLSK